MVRRGVETEGISTRAGVLLSAVEDERTGFCTMSASLAVPGAFEIAIKDFLDSLVDGNQYDLSHFQSIHDVYDETEKIQKEQGRRGALRNLQRIQPFLQRLSEYSGVVEVFVQVKPDVLALLWVCTSYS